MKSKIRQLGNLDRNMRKKLVAVLLCICFAVFAITGTAFAAGGFPNYCNWNSCKCGAGGYCIDCIEDKCPCVEKYHCDDCDHYGIVHEHGEEEE